MQGASIAKANMRPYVAERADRAVVPDNGACFNDRGGVDFHAL
jgi:hypothetical protein